MAHQRSVKGDRPWVGKDEAKANGRVSRRQVDREEIEAESADRCICPAVVRDDGCHLIICPQAPPFVWPW